MTPLSSQPHSEAGCNRLYTEDLQHGQEIEQLTVLSPFMGSP